MDKEPNKPAGSAPGGAAPPGSTGQEKPPVKVKVELPSGAVHEIEFSADMRVKSFYEELSTAFSISYWELAIVSTSGEIAVVYSSDFDNGGEALLTSLSTQADFDHFLITYPMMCA
jgi:hypothetical protein